MIGIGAEYLLRNIDNDYLHKKTYLDKHADEISLLILGSSHAYYGIDPAYLSVKSYNAANIAQSLDYDAAILHQYANRLKNLQYLVVPVDYLSLYNTLAFNAEKWRLKNYAIYFNIKKTNDLNENFEVFANKLEVNQNRLLDYYLKNKSVITCSDLGWGILPAIQQDLMVTGEKAAKRHTAKNNRFVAYNVKVLKSILNFAEKNHIKVLIYSSPAYDSYVKQLNELQVQNTNEQLKKLTTRYKAVYYANFLTDSSFTAQDYYDADHLNRVGAKKLSLKIDCLLKLMAKE
jgi:hypothetical protein